MVRRYLAGVDAALRGAALPYGYTVTLWSTGAVTIVERGTPNVGLVFLFALGAAAGYGVLKVLSQEESGGSDPVDVAASPHVVRAGIVHLAAIGLAIGAAALLAQIPSGVAWPLASLAATTIYLSLTSVEIALVTTDDASR